jgi:hypothetical protein
VVVTNMGSCEYVHHGPRTVVSLLHQCTVAMGHNPESASSPLMGFGVLNDNLIKGLISFVKCISRF